MKRGLVAAAGADRSVYEGRLERLRERLREQRVQVALIYGDVYRSDDIAHLTNLAIYWNEGVVAVPAEGPPVFLAKLSKRVHPWMQRTSVLEDLRASQNLPALFTTYFDELGPGTIGFVDRDWWPADLVDGITTAAQGRDTVDLPDAVRRTRLTPDELDRADLERAGQLVAAALTAAADAGSGIDERLAAIELSARGDGARDVLAACRRLPDGATQIECTVQFANVWAHAARRLGDGDALRQALDAGAAALAPGATLTDVQAAVGSSIGVTLVSHCDLATAGDLRPAGDPGAPLADGAVVALSVRIGDAIVADTYALDGERATPLTHTAAEVTA